MQQDIVSNHGIPAPYPTERVSFFTVRDLTEHNAESRKWYLCTHPPYLMSSLLFSTQHNTTARGALIVATLLHPCTFSHSTQSLHLPSLNYFNSHSFTNHHHLGWTAVTMDGSRSAQFEHTMLVTETGCELLTVRAGEPSDRLVWNADTWKR